MSKQEFLNFAEISKAIQFGDVLDWLNIPYQKKNKELKGEGFIISLEKNLFFTPNNDSLKGSIINSQAAVGVAPSTNRRNAQTKTTPENAN